MNNSQSDNKNIHLKERFYHRLALLVVFFFVAVSGFRYIETQDFQTASGIKTGLNVPIETLGDYKILALVGDTIGQHTNILTTQDGKKWQTTRTDAPWSPKSFQSVAYHNNSIFMAGGSGDSLERKNYFWKSDNGQTWTIPIIEIPWNSRSGHGFVSFKDSLWIFGGVDFVNEKIVFFDDIWSSKDGIYWQNITENAPWGERDIRSSIVFNNKIWLMGGSFFDNNNFDFKTYSDIWNSEDGVVWNKVEVPWGDVGISGSFVIGQSLFVLAGDAFNSEINIYKTDGEKNWQMVASDVPFRAYNFSIVNTPYHAFIIGGSNDEMPNRKVWKTNDGVHWSLVGETPIDIGEGMPAIVVPSNF